MLDQVANALETPCFAYHFQLPVGFRWGAFCITDDFVSSELMNGSAVLDRLLIRN